MPIRILHVVTSMNAGGIETMIMNIYRKIDRNRVQFDFLVHRDFKGFYDDEILKMGGKIYHIVPINFLNFFKYKIMLSKFFDSHKEYNIIHSHISILSYLVLKIAKKNDIPIRISHSHEAHNSIREYKLFKRPIVVYCKLRLNKQATHRFASSSNAGEWLFGLNKQFNVINNSIDAQSFTYKKDIRIIKQNELGITDKLVIGHIGNFSKAKNYPFLLNIFQSLHLKRENSVLILIGNNTYPDIENNVKKMGLEKSVIFTGVRSDIPELLQAMDVFVFPSLHEGLPVTLIEAQASGLQCVISDTITHETQITDMIEFISLKNTPDYWAERVLKYANGYERRDTYNDICKAGYDITKNAKWLEDFYVAANRESVQEQ